MVAVSPFSARRPGKADQEHQRGGGDHADPDGGQRVLSGQRLFPEEKAEGAGVAAKYELGRHEAAVADYDEAIRLKPDYAEAYSNRGEAKQKLRQYEAAVDDCNEAIRLKPNYAEAYNNRGISKGKLGLIDEARKDFETALELARNANNAKIVTQAEQLLRDLDAAEGS